MDSEEGRSCFKGKIERLYQREERYRMSKEEWQKQYVQCVLDYHNKKYGRNISIVGWWEDVYARRPGGHWDLVCHDETNGNEVAVEVKKLTIPQLEERAAILWAIPRQICTELSNELPGTFVLTVQIPEQNLDLRGSNKLMFKKVIKEVISKVAQNLDATEEQNLTEELKHRLPGIFPQDCNFVLKKLGNHGSRLSLLSGRTWLAPTKKLEGDEFAEFRKLIQKANTQLAEVQKKEISETFLILVEIGHSGADADVLQNTLSCLDPTDYSYIKCIYRVGSISPCSVQELLIH